MFRDEFKMAKPAIYGLAQAWREELDRDPDTENRQKLTETLVEDIDVVIDSLRGFKMFAEANPDEVIDLVYVLTDPMAW